MTQALATPRHAQAPIGITDGLGGRSHGKRPKRVQAAAGTMGVAAQAEAVLKAFNTWAYKREQPSCAERLRDVVTHAVTLTAPIPFVLYWGKGPRTEVAAPDLACLDYLASMAARIRAAYGAGASVRLILTDTHAKLNGHAVEAADAYFAGIAGAAAARGFATVRLSTLVATAADGGRPESDVAPTGAVLDNLVACAAKWYRGEGSTEGGAVEYYRMNMVERRAVEHAYPQAIFATFNNSEFRELFPATMPIFYMYSLKRGVGVKPWFMPADEPEPDTTSVTPANTIFAEA
ncbi:MAG: hypothetical protein ACRYGP_08990 [Janthinobacterium lividum]